MSCFYDKEIQIYTYTDGKDSYGINRKGYTLLVTDEPILVDIQCYSSEKAKIDYGYNIETTKRMFCDIIPQITESAIIKYKEQFYSVQKIPWDDEYMEVMLLETKDVTNIG